MYILIFPPRRRKRVFHLFTYTLYLHKSVSLKSIHSILPDMSSSYDWLCCYCSDAVISRSVSEQCFNCGHILCSKCAVEDPKYSLASVTNKLQTTLTSNGLETIRSMSSCMHVYDQPLTRIDVQEIDPASQFEGW
ncbi:hypothetical protein BU24DRAFT_215045 [Aaosphaeria arxii CBS 175.79]|uniref:Uncharacterized protein n=1 Tax=Aaosphaeria arxii CBS 175.79 TaxID=1450172 RepID=A0A6A5XNR4_9PLEO|nr:uncharacterized protein BU24DRAFT_215045 [Aaosphaeria arxii CBS 175.79]KAF2014487.1 hypothetical protein BU24DRAFT_215045 [Aaosphaeria arxii CBS 175.79]